MHEHRNRKRTGNIGQSATVCHSYEACLVLFCAECTTTHLEVLCICTGGGLEGYPCRLGANATTVSVQYAVKPEAKYTLGGRAGTSTPTPLRLRSPPTPTSNAQALHVTSSTDRHAN
ncbi:unnamed protein product [Clonostachys chloroleuca]|uniref:Uncharacterized protein n=1 Tax=Clonostachys chloroleuca TaxID=1926264 RepID=A0AA35Q0M5_9HYPO|nr:unnamed protein product [Clonostachys chloroleuca]